MQQVVVHHKFRMPTVEALTDIVIAVLGKIPAVYAQECSDNKLHRVYSGNIPWGGIMSTTLTEECIDNVVVQIVANVSTVGGFCYVRQFLDDLDRSSKAYVDVVIAGHHDIGKIARIIEIPNNITYRIGHPPIPEEYYYINGIRKSRPEYSNLFEYVEEIGRYWDIKETVYTNDDEMERAVTATDL